MLKIVMSVIVMAVCLYGFYRNARLIGYYEGVEDGTMLVLHDMCAGDIRVQDGKLVFGDVGYAFHDAKTGEKLDELDIDKLTFIEK